jgi:hypothetical protein
MTYYHLKWKVEFHKDFDPEFDALPDDVRTLCGASPSRSIRDATQSF